MKTLNHTLLFLLLPVSLHAQSSSQERAFAPYTTCSFTDGLTMVATDPLTPGTISRTVTTMKGTYSVALAAGRRVMFAYPGEDFYANVKVEILPEQGYAASREALISDFEHTLASGDAARNYVLKPRLNGFQIQGLDRVKREGGVLGIYLFFDDAHRAVTTIYFLNQDPPKHFKTMSEYAILRDHFLDQYTSCIRKAATP